MSTKTLDYLGVRLHRLTQNELISEVRASVVQKRQLTFSYYGFHTANIITSNRAAKELFDSLGILMPDGIAILYTTWLFGVPMATKNRGNGDIIAPYLFPEAVRQGWKIYLLGGAPGIASEAAEKLQLAFSGLQIVGTHHGYLSSEAMNQAVVNDINQSGATIVIVGMGQPLQEQWIVSRKARVHAPVLLAVGGFFDHLCRRVDCYPAWVYRSKLNWAYRLFTEPGRLWKRYTLGALRFGMHLCWAICMRFFSRLARKFTKQSERL